MKVLLKDLLIKLKKKSKNFMEKMLPKVTVTVKLLTKVTPKEYRT